LTYSLGITFSGVACIQIDTASDVTIYGNGFTFSTTSNATAITINGTKERGESVKSTKTEGGERSE
jgi:hypothetical protein